VTLAIILSYWFLDGQGEFFLFGAVTFEPLHEFFKVDFVSVKFWAVYAGELCFAVN
jgi:hypothetical protein